MKLVSSTPVEVAARCVAEFEAASEAYAKAAHEEMALEAERPMQKHEAILRIMQFESKAYTAAEKTAEGDEAYRAFLLRWREACRTTIRTRAQAEAARLRTEIQIAVIRTNGSLG